MSGTKSAFSWQHMVHTVRRNLLGLALAGAIGAALGLLVAISNPTYKATVLLGVRTSADVSTSVVTETAAVSIVSPAVIEQAAAQLGINEGDLASQTTARVQSGTTLIELTAADPDPQAAVRNATKVAEAAIQDYVDRSAAIAEDVRQAGDAQLTSGALGDPTAEKTRQESIGTTVGGAQGQSITGSVTISIVSPALHAYLGGVSKLVGVILGGAAGVLAGTLLVLSGGWQRSRKIRSAADLEDALTARAVFPSRDVAGITGAILGAGDTNVFLFGGDPAARRALAANLAKGLRRNGVRVGQVSILSGELADEPLKGRDESWTVGADQSAAVLARSERTRMRESFGTEMVLVDLAELGDAAVFLAGQSDFLPLIMVPAGQRIARVMAEVRPLESASPILVVVER